MSDFQDTACCKVWLAHRLWRGQLAAVRLYFLPDTGFLGSSLLYNAVTHRYSSFPLHGHVLPVPGFSATCRCPGRQPRGQEGALYLFSVAPSAVRKGPRHCCPRHRVWRQCGSWLAHRQALRLGCVIGGLCCTPAEPDRFPQELAGTWSPSHTPAVSSWDWQIPTDETGHRVF